MQWIKPQKVRLYFIKLNLKHIVTDVGDKRLEILQWLGGREQSIKNQDEYKKCAEGTGEWLLQHQDYTTWREAPGKFLWVNGNGQCLPFVVFDV